MNVLTGISLDRKIIVGSQHELREIIVTLPPVDTEVLAERERLGRLQLDALLHRMACLGQAFHTNERSASRYASNMTRVMDGYFFCLYPL